MPGGCILFACERGTIMSRPMQWLSLVGGILILGYGVVKVVQPQPEWTLMILGLLIVAFSVSKIVKSMPGNGSRGEKQKREAGSRKQE